MPRKEARYCSGGKSLCGNHYKFWYPPRPDVQDDDERCCAKCREALVLAREITDSSG